MYCHVCPEAEQLNIMNRLVAIFGSSEEHIVVLYVAVPSPDQYLQMQKEKKR